MITPLIKYQENSIIGPAHPTSSESFLENKIISSNGFEKSEYKLLNAYDHFSISYVTRWSGVAMRESKFVIL